MSILERMQSPGPKKILTLDGGGIRGILTIEVLDEIETLLRKKLGKGPEFVLAALEPNEILPSFQDFPRAQYENKIILKNCFTE